MHMHETGKLINVGSYIKAKSIEVQYIHDHIFIKDLLHRKFVEISLYKILDYSDNYALSK